MNNATVSLKKHCGFAAMTPERRKEISSMGGKAAHAGGMAHRFTSEQAKIAGSKGGSVPRVKRDSK